MKIAKNEEVAYLAGIVGSDGCMGLYNSNYEETDIYALCEKIRILNKKGV